MKKIMICLWSLLLIGTLLVGCGVKGTKTSLFHTKKETAVVGSFLLSVNPEIQVQYNAKGDVIAAYGVNRDGEKVLAECTSLEGQASENAVGNLVKKIYEEGYFENKISGHDRNIVIKMEPNSQMPSSDFANKLAEEANKVVEAEGETSSVVVIQEDALDEGGKISEEKAKELVRTQLGMSDAEFIHCIYEPKENVYEIELRINGIVYEYEVDASNGKIVEMESETEVDTDADDDTEDDLNEDADDDTNDDLDEDADDDTEDDLDGDSDDVDDDDTDDDTDGVADDDMDDDPADDDTDDDSDDDREDDSEDEADDGDDDDSDDGAEDEDD